MRSFLSFRIALALVVTSSYSFAQEVDLYINSVVEKVPVGELGEKWFDAPPLIGDAPDPERIPFTSAHSNSTAGISMTNTASWGRIDASITTENLASEPFRTNGGGCTAFLDDRLTITDATAATGTAARLMVEFEISGEFRVTESTFIGDRDNNLFDGIPTMRVRMESAESAALEDIRVELDGDLLFAEGGPVPRTVNGTYPFRASGSATLSFDLGEPLLLSVRGGPSLSYMGETYRGGIVPPDDGVTFERLSDIGTLACDYKGRITRMEIIERSTPLSAPVISSGSGFDYNSFLTPPPPFRITAIRTNAAGTDLLLDWNSGGAGGAFRVRSSPDLNTAPATWPILRSNISNAGATTSTSIPISEVNSPRQFFVVEEQ